MRANQAAERTAKALWYSFYSKHDGTCRQQNGSGLDAEGAHSKRERGSMARAVRQAVSPSRLAEQVNK
jgi:hypothetical protein